MIEDPSDVSGKCSKTCHLGLLVALAATLVCLLPFLGKAYTIDDTLFLYAAQRIQREPFDFYGFGVNWYGFEMPMSQVTMNPPLGAFYIAWTAAVGGWNEKIMHLAFLLPALAAIGGCFALAWRLCRHPLAATLAVLACPAFLVSATSIMCDVPMLALWIWAVVLWISGMDRNNFLMLTLSSLLVSLAVLTKYFGICLVPLLFTFSWTKKGNFSRWPLPLLIPLAVLGLYQWGTHLLYGQAMLSEAARYATIHRWTRETDNLTRLLTGLAFTGGCMAPAFFFAPFLWSRNTLLGLALSGFIATMVVLSWGGLGAFQWKQTGGPPWEWLAQFGLWSAGGISILALGWTDWRKNREAESLLLLLWVAGTFVFTVFVNWTVSARYLLPMTPAVTILLARRLEIRLPALRIPPRLAWAAPLGLSIVLSLWVTWGDTQYANANRTATAQIKKQAAGHPGTVWFQGHWGFQHYMEQSGFKPVDKTRSSLKPGDVLVIPVNNINLFNLPRHLLEPLPSIQIPQKTGVTTVSWERGAGFYSDVKGPLPFVIGRASPEKFLVFILKGGIRFE